MHSVTRHCGGLVMHWLFAGTGSEMPVAAPAAEDTPPATVEDTPSNTTVDASPPDTKSPQNCTPEEEAAWQADKTPDPCVHGLAPPKQSPAPQNAEPTATTSGQAGPACTPSEEAAWQPPPASTSLPGHGHFGYSCDLLLKTVCATLWLFVVLCLRRAVTAPFPSCLL
jgi:hypothetical protein